MFVCLCQLEGVYELGMEDDVTPEDLLNLAVPLTLQAMGWIEEALKRTSSV